FDLYITYQRDGAWSKPANLGDQINSSGNEYSPAISPDGKYFFWTSPRGFADKPLEKRLDYAELITKLRGPQNGLGDIYQIDVSALKSGKRSTSRQKRASVMVLMSMCLMRMWIFNELRSSGQR